MSKRIAVNETDPPNASFKRADFLLGSYKNGQVGIGILPGIQEGVVHRSASCDVAHPLQGAGAPELRKRSECGPPVRPIDHFLELGRGVRRAVCGQVR